MLSRTHTPADESRRKPRRMRRREIAVIASAVLSLGGLAAIEAGALEALPPIDGGGVQAAEVSEIQPAPPASSIVVDDRAQIAAAVDQLPEPAAPEPAPAAEAEPEPAPAAEPEPVPTPHEHESTPAVAAGGGTVWDRLADCESGDWDSSGTPIPGSYRWDYGLNFSHGDNFEGGVNFAPGTWDSYRSASMADHAGNASRAQQIAVAEQVLDDQGWNAWPVCSDKLGL